MLYLKQSTSVTLKIGPFIDDTDGKTAETGLTEHQADIRISKNGANIIQKNEASSCTYDELGIYDCPIDDTDTNTLGRLQLWCHEAGFLPVFHEYTVLAANVFDALVGGGDYLDVATAELANIDFGATMKTSLDTIGDTVITNGKAAIADSVWDEVISAGTHDVADSPAIYLRNIYQSIVTRIAQATGGGVATITLDALASGVDDFYKGQIIAVCGGQGAGQARACYAYNGTTCQASIRPAWATPPNNTSWFSILNVGSAVVAAMEDIDFSATMKTSLDTIGDTVVSDIHTDVADVHTDVGTAIANIGTVGGYVDTEVAAIKAVTDTLTLGAIADAVHDEAVEGAVTNRQSMRLILAALAGKTSEAVAGTMVIRDANDTADRITATMDANRYRTGVVLNP
jgi:hypothetical protein